MRYNNTLTNNEPNRFYVVDALRGFAIIAIMLLHNIEHFDLYIFPENQPAWLAATDQLVWKSLFFLFGGKAFAIFALLFGLTFQIQFHNQAKRGRDFRGRFAWRLLLLFGFGLINSAFFQGDILTIYAALGFLLIPFARVNDKIVLAVAVLLFLQPLEWLNIAATIQNPDLVPENPRSWAFFGKMSAYATGDSFWATVQGNLTNGKRAVLLWNWENGRFFQIGALFLLGMLLGRKERFHWSPQNSIFWKKILIASAIAFIPLFLLQLSLPRLISSKALSDSLLLIEKSWTNLSFMMILVSGFTLLYHNKYANKWLSLLNPAGKMSLSNYLLQSVAGTILYYGYGLGLYQYTGASLSLLIGLGLSALFLSFCTLWAKTHRHGPLEYLWHKATWIGR
jgi:uncharacterized protein